MKTSKNIIVTLNYSEIHSAIEDLKVTNMLLENPSKAIDKIISLSELSKNKKVKNALLKEKDKLIKVYRLIGYIHYNENIDEKIQINNDDLLIAIVYDKFKDKLNEFNITSKENVLKMKKLVDDLVWIYDNYVKEVYDEYYYTFLYPYLEQEYDTFQLFTLSNLATIRYLILSGLEKTELLEYIKGVIELNSKVICNFAKEKLKNKLCFPYYYDKARKIIDIRYSLKNPILKIKKKHFIKDVIYYDDLKYLKFRGEFNESLSTKDTKMVKLKAISLFLPYVVYYCSTRETRVNIINYLVTLELFKRLFSIKKQFANEVLITSAIIDTLNQYTKSDQKVSYYAIEQFLHTICGIITSRYCHYLILDPYDKSISGISVQALRLFSSMIYYGKISTSSIIKEIPNLVETKLAEKKLNLIINNIDQIIKILKVSGIGTGNEEYINFWMLTKILCRVDNFERYLPIIRDLGYIYDNMIDYNKYRKIFLQSEFKYKWTKIISILLLYKYRYVPLKEHKPTPPGILLDHNPFINWLSTKYENLKDVLNELSLWKDDERETILSIIKNTIQSRKKFVHLINVLSKKCTL